MALETSLIHNWRLNGNSNDNKSTYHGTDTSMTYVAGRKGNQAGNFSGSGHIAITSTDFPTGNAAVSIAFWTKLTSTAYQSFFSYGTVGAGQGFIPGINSGGANGYPMVSQYGTNRLGADAINDDLWRFVVITCSGDATPNYTVYVDGQVSGTPGTMTTVRETGGGYIGTDYTAVPDDELVGLMQDIALWSKEVTSAEVTSLWNSGNGMYFDGSVFQNYAPDAVGGPSGYKSLLGVGQA